MTNDAETMGAHAQTHRFVRTGVLLGLVGMLALLVAACGGEDPTATPVPPQATSTLDAAAIFQAEWDALIAAAQEEGELTMVLGGSAGRNFRPIAQAFGERFGIEVTVVVEPDRPLEDAEESETKSEGEGTAEGTRPAASDEKKPSPQPEQATAVDPD